MKNIVQNTSLAVIKYYSEHASADKIFEYLSKRKDEQTALISKEHSDNIEAILFDLNKPLVNLGLACFGENIDILRELYNGPGKEIKLAVLSNSNAFQDRSMTFKNILSVKELEEIILVGDLDEQKAILQNSNLSDELIFQLYNKINIFESIEENHWQKLITHTIDRYKYLVPAVRSEDRDIEASLQSNSKEKMICSAWHLANTVPVKDSWATVLMGLYENLPKAKLPITEIHSAISRWDGYGSDNEENDAYFTIRTHLADFIPINSETQNYFVSSDDFAIRASFYKRFVPNQMSEVVEYFEKDREKFLYWAILNRHILCNEHYSSKILNFCHKVDDNEPFYSQIYLQKLNKITKN